MSVRRRVHVGAAIFYALFLYVFSPMNLIVIGWFADFEDAISHRVHEVSIGALFTVGFIGVLGHVRKTDRAAGEVQAVVALSVAAGVITASTGFEPLAFAYLLPPVALIALDPQWRHVVAPPFRPETRLLMFAAILLGILGPDVVTNFEKATLLVQGHESHWGAIAAFAVAVSLLVFIAAIRPPGWRLAAWSVIGAVTIAAVVSMAFRYDASALGVSHSIAVLLWGAGFGVTVFLVGAHDLERIPVRRPDRGLVAGVAAGIAERTGWNVGWVRAAFAIPIIGGAAYGVLWIALPADGDGRVARRRARALVLTALLAVGVSSVVIGSEGGFLLMAGAVATTMALGLRPLISLARRRARWGRAIAKVAAGVGLGVALLAVVVVWMSDDLGPPDVPHRIQGESFQYCASCHGASGVARGAPVLADIVEHSGGELCVSCHSHLPVSADAPSAASWRLPLTTEMP